MAGSGLVYGSALKKRIRFTSVTKTTSQKHSTKSSRSSRRSSAPSPKESTKTPVVPVETEDQAEKDFEEKQAKLRKTRHLMKEQGTDTSNVDRMIKESQQERFQRRRAKLVEAVVQKKELPLYARVRRVSRNLEGEQTVKQLKVTDGMLVSETTKYTRQDPSDLPLVTNRELLETAETKGMSAFGSSVGISMLQRKEDPISVKVTSIKNRRKEAMDELFTPVQYKVLIY